MLTMDLRGRWDDFLGAFAGVPSMQEELATKQPPAALATLAHITEQIASAAQAASRFLEPLLNPTPEVAEGAIELVMAMKAFNDAMKAHGGDPEEAIFWVLALTYLERKPDSLLTTRLNHDLRRDDFDEMPLENFWDLLDHHKARLTRDSELEHAHRETAAIRRGIKKYASLVVALDALRLEGQTRDEVLEEMIPGAAYAEKAELPPGGSLPGRVANAIRKEGFGLLPPPEPQKSEKFGIVGELKRPGTKQPTAPDVPELAGFITLESLKRDAVKAGLSAQELASLVFGELLGDKKAAEVLGRPAKQVAQEKLRAKRKLRRAV